MPTRSRKQRASASLSRKLSTLRPMTPAVLTEFVLNGLVLGALYVLMALGLSIIFGMIGVINFAHGALFTLGACAAYQLKGALGFPVTLVVAPILVGVLGMLIEATLLRRLYREDPLQGLLLTFGLAMVLEQGIRLVWGLSPKPFDVPAALAGVQPAMGVNVGTAAFVVVTIGGLGSLLGAIISGLLVGQVVSLSIYFQPRVAEASMYVLMAVILLLRPRGLMGEHWDKFD